MEMSGQLHAPAALPPGKEPLLPIGYFLSSFSYFHCVGVPFVTDINTLLRS